MRKNLLFLLVTLMLALVLVSCISTKGTMEGTQGFSQANPEGWPAPPKNRALDPSEIVIAFYMFQSDQFFDIMTLGAQAAAEEYGVTLLTGNFDNDTAKEMECLNSCIDQGVNGLVWNTVEGASINELKRVVASGIPVTLTTPLNEADAMHFYGLFCNDPKELGYSCGVNSVKIIREKFGDERIEIAVLQFSAQEAVRSAERVDSFLKALDEGGISYKIVSNQDAWMAETAMSATADILEKHPDVDLIFGGNVGASVGATLGVKNAGKAGQTIVCGIDSSLQLLEMLRSDDDILQVCAGQNPYYSGYYSVEQVIKVLMGGYDSQECSRYYGKLVVMDTLNLVRGDEVGLQKYEDFMLDLGITE